MVWSLVTLFVIIPAILLVVVFIPGAGAGGTGVIGSTIMGLASIIMVPGLQVLAFFGVLMLPGILVVGTIAVIIGVHLFMALSALSPFIAVFMGIFGIIGLIVALFLSLLFITVSLVVFVLFLIAFVLALVFSPAILTGLMVGLLLTPESEGGLMVVEEPMMVEATRATLFDFTDVLSHLAGIESTSFPYLDMLPKLF